LNSKPIVAALAVGLIVFGVALRIRNYAADYSLNHDDICLALNVMNRDIRGLTRTLNFEQAAPLGFLWLERILI
jgi:hypothetical protein